ncbi:MAG: peptidyl-alpha-hydroxyglycine alpha-amidating lyase family protein [Vicinamibacterales bacterium]
MTKFVVSAVVALSAAAALGAAVGRADVQRGPAPAPLPLGQPGPNVPAGKAPEQGFVPEAWPRHEGALLKYRVLIRFGEEPDTMPDGFKFGRASAVTTDAQGNVYAFQRGPKADPVIVFDSTGKYLRSWGKGVFGNPHGIRIDKEGNVWCVDNGNQQVYKFSPDGKLLQTWGTKGVMGSDEKTFGRPTDIAWDSQGNFYISDGYVNTRVVKFDKTGKYVTAWGTPGDGPGQFRVVHSIGIDSKDRLYVSDRENNRIQIFDVRGTLLKTWTHLGATQGIFITPRDQMWIITHRNNTENITYDTLAGQLMHVDIETGKVLGSMESPGHELTVTPAGDIYVASLTGNIFKWSPMPNWPEKAAK